jgi:hypothetical protein
MNRSDKPRVRKDERAPKLLRSEQAPDREPAEDRQKIL